MKPPSRCVTQARRAGPGRPLLLGAVALLWLAAAFNAAWAQNTVPSVAPAPASIGRGLAQIGQAPGLPAGTGLPRVLPSPPGTTVSPAASVSPNAPVFSLPNSPGVPSPFPPQFSLPTPPGVPTPFPPQLSLPPGTPAPFIQPPGVGQVTPVQPLVPSGGRAVVPIPVPVPVVPGAVAQPVPIPPPYTALQILQSFLAADFNRDGELTRAEALNLPIMPFSFEQMDRNKDGVLTRLEYENAFQ